MAFLSALGQAAPGRADDLQTSNYSGAIDNSQKNYDQATANQGGLISTLQSIISGKTPSLAEQQLQNSTQKNAQSAAAAIASQHGINPGLAARQIQDTAATVNQDEAGQAAANRIAEQQSSQALLGNILQGQTGTDVNLLNVGAGAQNKQNDQALQNQQLQQDAYKTNLGAATNLFGSLLGAGGTAGAAALGLPHSGAAPAGPSYGAPTAAPNFGSNGGLGVNGPNPSNPGSVITTRMAHGGDVKPMRREFMKAYVGSQAAQRPALLAAFHAGKEHAQNMDAGGEVKGPPAPYAGDDTRNDDEPIMASEGEHVVPRSVSQNSKYAALMKELKRAEQSAKRRAA